MADFRPLPGEERRARAAELAPVLRGLASTDRPQVGHFNDSDVVLEVRDAQPLRRFEPADADAAAWRAAAPASASPASPRQHPPAQAGGRPN